MNLFTKLKKMDLLLIDDDEWIRDSLTLYFESEGCRITALETAEEGLNIIKQKQFDIIITDYRLPGMNGLEVIRRLRQRGRDFPILILTARSGWQDKVEGLMAQAGLLEEGESLYDAGNIRLLHHLNALGSLQQVDRF